MSGSDPLRTSRLDGNTMGLGCLDCPLRQECGGFSRVGGGWSCRSACADCDRETCDKVCLANPRFAVDVREVNGFQFDGLRIVGDHQEFLATESLPRYVPLIYHASGREKELDVQWVAAPLGQLFRRPEGVPHVAFGSRSEFMAQMRIVGSAKLLLSGIAKDPPIEDYWHWRKEAGFIEGISEIRPDLAIAPNYSMFLNDPRTQHLFNRKRLLICADEWARSGVMAVPPLQAVNEHDYQYWLEMLRRFSGVSIICQEFQTGLRNPERARLAIERVAAFQDSLQRPLHLIAVGGYQHRAELREHFQTWTIVDATPFLKAQKRRRAFLRDGTLAWAKSETDSVDSLLTRNIEMRQRLVEEELTPQERAPRIQPVAPPSFDHRQRTLW